MLNRRVVSELLLVATVLLTISYFVHCQINNKLNTALYESVLRHINTVSYSIEHTIDSKFDEITLLRDAIERGDISVDNLVSVPNGYGFVRKNGENIGRSLSQQEFSEIATAFSGENVVVYHGSGGLLCAVPIISRGENCVLYQKLNADGVIALFRLVSYNGFGEISLANYNGEWLEISDSAQSNSNYDDFIHDQQFIQMFKVAIADKTLNQDRFVTQYEYKNREFIGFGSVIYDKKLRIFGFIPVEAISAGIEYIHIAMLGVMILMCMILIMFTRNAIKTAENKELKVERELAWQASRTKSEFLSNMSHEIRTPINAILGMNEMILRESRDETILEYSENIRNASNNLLGLVNDILDFSKIEAGKMEIIPVEYELSSLLNDLVNMIKARAEKKGLQLNVNADKDLPSILYGDEIRLKQIVTNILTNAVKYTEKGSVTLKIELAERIDDRIKLKFSVKDTGIGIKPADIKKLYSAFERIEEKRNRTIEGTGLGMNITKKLLNMMNTSLQVESVYGEGSLFWFEIEQRVIKSEPIGDFEESFRNSLKHHKTYREKFTAPEAKILVVDDTIMNLTVVKGLLKQTQIQIDTAESGFDALKLITKNIYDIIFLDHRMPEMDGIETLRKMQNMRENLNETTPVISLTANAISGAREQYISAGFQDYLTKPIDSAKLEEMIMKYLPPDKIKAAATDSPAEEIEIPAWLLKIDGLNVQEGITHCGDLKSYIDALTVFANSINSGADEIESYYKNSDWKLYTTKVHALTKV